MGEVTTTERFLALEFLGLAVTDHMMVKLTFEWKTGFASFTFILSIIMNVQVKSVGTGCAEELFTLLTLQFGMFPFEMVISFFTGGPLKVTHEALK